MVFNFKQQFVGKKRKVYVSIMCVSLMKASDWSDAVTAFVTLSAISVFSIGKAHHFNQKHIIKLYMQS